MCRSELRRACEGRNRRTVRTDSASLMLSFATARVAWLWLGPVGDFIDFDRKWVVVGFGFAGVGVGVMGGCRG
uniref:Uncharacterized protein n=1 Tax=Fagus sylvatica TaxID=28930 RepID=A0A2N9FAW6_FAGSY